MLPTIFQAASTSSRRVKSVWSPRSASSSRRSYASGCGAEDAAVAEVHAHRARPVALAGDLGGEAHRDAFLRLHADDEHVGQRGALSEERVRQGAEVDGDLGGALGHPLAGADVERHAVPAPGADVEAHRREGGRARALGDVLFLLVALHVGAGHAARGVLAEHHVVQHLLGRGEGLDGAQHLDLLVAHRIGIERHRRFHRGEADELEDVVLQHVAEDARLFVVAAARLDAQLLARGDLHVVDVAAVPDGLEDGIGEAQDEEVLDGLLAEVVVDAEDLLLVAGLQHQPVQRARARQIAAEGLLDHRPGEGALERRVDQPGRLELLEQGGKGAGRRGEVVEPVALRGAGLVQLLELRAQPREGVGIVEGAGDVAHAGGEILPHLGVHRLLPRELAHRLAHVARELVVGVGALGDADDAEGGRQVRAEREVVERRNELAVGEVAARAEDDHRTGLGRRLDAEPRAERVRHLVVFGRVGQAQLFFTAWPPNSLRSAACTLALKLSSWREAMRICRASVITGAGTFWSMAACTVQRPSPLSST